MTGDEEPRGVGFLKDALAERLGRPAASRAARGNLFEWYIIDPCFSVIQRVGSRRSGYRSGIQVRDGDISFYNVHSRTPAKQLKKNLKQRPEAIISAAEGCLHLRDYHYLHFCSRQVSRQTGARRWADTVRVIKSPEWEEFKAEIEKDLNSLVKDLFPELGSTGHVGTGEAMRGSDFSLFLADYQQIEFAVTDSLAAERAAAVIDAAWHLFSCLYTWEPVRRRDASLRRAMLSSPGLCDCEYERIAGVAKTACDGSAVEAAHIIPYARGGSDRAWNGVWLCSKHHRATEGKLSGRRTGPALSEVQVRFTASK
ncbi:HNH endonuclease domain protein [Synechococcus sp. PCC 7335]|uniref:HNH endonuclease n=1 Tax=Synechococcus sp. (strain ATCC 29403 / PCC 7335) TaxID=91464 RepID=UPI00017ECF22|nr:HNH endonuclease [Synechococcus sp. PCC 7335]EDX82861.1 HNH endonuclease domain protein [Synechococcus sp. PCC 7335]